MKKLTIWVCLLLLAVSTLYSSCTNEDAFSILGNWDITMIYAETYVYDGGIITFAGSETSGIVSVNFPPDTQIGSGPYTVNGNTLEFTITWPDAGYIDTCTGTIVDSNNMNGTLVENPGSTDGTWTCTR